ncbi:hypothetical protein [Actinacidiphila sp. bgisy144]|uniref:hypothetical protein n=1 Tax=Actinacidiphila sp. bgisy144 TaxID=3413791 RepID=UPI003EB921AF
MGTLAAGSVPTNLAIGAWTSVAPFTCSGPVGLVLTVTGGQLPWNMEVAGYDTATDTTTGTLTGMSMHWSGVGTAADFDGPGGAGSGTGSEAFSYDNATHQLTLGDGDLEAYDVKGTFLGFLNDGDGMTFGFTMPVTPAQTIRPDGAAG